MSRSKANKRLPLKGDGGSLYLSLGSNLGDREDMLRRAITLIEERVGAVQRVSSFIECLDRTQQIERELGRKKKSKNGIYHDRPIDIDLLLYGDLKLSTPRLTIPHPHMYERDFVMIPLREILPSIEEGKT